MVRTGDKESWWCDLGQISSLLRISICKMRMNTLPYRGAVRSKTVQRWKMLQKCKFLMSTHYSPAYLTVKFTGSGAPFTLNLNSSVNSPRMVELKEIWMAWNPPGRMMPSLGSRVKQAPSAVDGGIKVKRASMAPLLDRAACSRKGKERKHPRNLYFSQIKLICFLIKWLISEKERRSDKTLPVGSQGKYSGLNSALNSICNDSK